MTHCFDEIKHAYFNNLTSTQIQTFDAMIPTYATYLDFSHAWNSLHNNNIPRIDHYTYVNGFIYFQHKVCVTASFRKLAMLEMHALPYMGHRDIQTTIAICKEYFFWPNMKHDIAQFVSECIVCQQVKCHHRKSLGLLMPLPIPNAPWEQISMDFIIDSIVILNHY